MNLIYQNVFAFVNVLSELLTVYQVLGFILFHVQLSYFFLFW